jgi:hypothetical protein
VELLLQRGLHCVENLSHAEMMSLYDDSRLAPNECIAWESNFRLLEAASAGCCVLSPDVGEDQNALLEPGKEFLVWHDGPELLDRIAWAKMRPGRAEEIGRAAFARVNSCHLPEHRARTLLETARVLSRNRLEGAFARIAFWLAIAKQLRNGAVRTNAGEHVKIGLSLLENLPELERLPEKNHTLVSHLISQCLILPALCRKNGDEALRMCRSLAASSLKSFAGRLETASVASALALREGDYSLARFFWMLYNEKIKERHGQRTKHEQRAIPDNPVELCCRWAAALNKGGKLAQVGSAFKSEEGVLPECALEYLEFAELFIPGGTEEADNVDVNSARRRICSLKRDMTEGPAYLSRHLNSLDDLSRLEPENWQIHLAYGISCLKACLVEEGICVISEARRKALAAGQKQLFESRCRDLNCTVGNWDQRER